MIARIDRPTAHDTCVFYGRVSTTRQKIDQQIELGESWCSAEGVRIADRHWFKDVEKRHRAEKRAEFQALLAECRRGGIDWVVVAAFDRWGVKDIDEFFEYRRQLKNAGVRLWSIQDQLDLTSANSMDVQRIFSLAVASTLQMEFYADRNVMKMIERSLNGWHLSINHPYGTDLLCCRLSDRTPIYRLHQLTKAIKGRGKREYLVQHLGDDGEVLREEHVNKAPLRDCKETGYRLTPTIAEERVEAVRLIFDLYDDGCGNGDIAKALDDRGITYFGRNWGWQCVESILCNPAYVGRPAWGKIATGTYRQVYEGRSQPARTKPVTGAVSYMKDVEHHVSPRELVFEPIVEPEVFERVQERRRSRTEDRSQYKQRSPAKHPLAGLVYCPDCDRPMVLHSSQSRGNEPIRYFLCSTYAKTRRKECRANSVNWKKLDPVADCVLRRVEEYLGGFDGLRPEHLDPGKAFGDLAKWVGPTVDAVTEVIRRMTGEKVEFEAIDYLEDSKEEIRRKQRLVVDAFDRAVTAWEKERSKSEKTRRKRLDEIADRIDHYHEHAEETPSNQHRQRYWSKVEELEAERERLVQQDGSLRSTLSVLLDEGRSVKAAFDEARQLGDAVVWRGLVEKVVPQFDRKLCKDGVERSYLRAFDFVPVESAKQVVEGAIEFQCTPRGRGSWRRRASRGPGR